MGKTRTRNVQDSTAGAALLPDWEPDAEEEGQEGPPHPADIVENAPPGRDRRVLPPERTNLIHDPIGGAIPANEPVFILRASDRPAPDILRAWLEHNAAAAPHWINRVRVLIHACETWPDRRQAGWLPGGNEE